MTEIAVELSEEDADRIAAIAEWRSESSASIVREAVAKYLDHDAEIRAAVQEGIDSAGRGELEDFEVVADRMRARLSARLAAQAE